MNADILKQFRDCKHEDVHLQAMELVPLAKVFPKMKDLPDNIFVRGLAAQECLRCGAVVGISTPVHNFLKELTGELEKVHEGDAVMIDLNYTRPTPNLKQSAAIEEVRLAETASFRAQVPTLDLDDVVLSDETGATLQQIQARIGYADLFYVHYDFQRVRPYGKATVILFYGPSGTGKTRTAQALAKSMGKLFLDVNLADLESRFMSQTGKNIREAFAAAKAEDAVIFFDEADTVLGRRLSSVTQGIDAEINMSRSTMLKELELFEGVCIFATNFESNIDKAFVRRITYKVPFQLPDEAVRRALWQYYLINTLPLREPAAAWMDELALASDGLTGADIASAIELSFPAAVLEDPDSPLIKKAFLLDAIVVIRQGKSAVGTDREVEMIKDHYGLTTKGREAGGDPDAGDSTIIKAN